MIHKQAKPPRTQRIFYSSWGELDYLCKKIRYWLYTRKQMARAERYLDRLATTLRALPENDLAIIQEEGLALFNELKGDLGAAIVHREREISLTERLHLEAQSSRYDDDTRAYMLRDRDIIDLHARRAIVEALKKEQMQNQKPKQPKKYRRIATTSAT